MPDTTPPLVLPLDCVKPKQSKQNDANTGSAFKQVSFITQRQIRNWRVADRKQPQQLLCKMCSILLRAS